MQFLCRFSGSLFTWFDIYMQLSRTDNHQFYNEGLFTMKG